MLQNLDHNNIVTDLQDGVETALVVIICRADKWHPYLTFVRQPRHRQLIYSLLQMYP